MAKKTTIVLVDDHAVVRAGVRRLLEQEPLFEVIGEAESGEKAYQIFGELKPDVMVMDLVCQVCESASMKSTEK